MSAWIPSGDDDPQKPSPSTPDADSESDRLDELDGGFRHVFGGEIPEAERAWRRGEEPVEIGPGAAIPTTLMWALEALPRTLQEIRAEVRRATDLATDALASRSRPESEAAPEEDGGMRPFDPFPAALRELREEVREAADRTTEILAATRRGTDSLPAIASVLREEFDRLTGRLTDTLTAANLEAARAFSLVAREVRTLGDRQAVLREEVRLLGKRFEEVERMRRRQTVQRSPSRRPEPPPPPEEAP